MITTDRRNTQGQMHKNISLLNETLSPTEANDILLGMIESQINFYKLKYMSAWEGNHAGTEENGEDKIKALETQKMKIKQMIMEARFEGCNLVLDSSINVKCDKNK